MFDQDPLMIIAADVGAPVEVGSVAGHIRRFVPITGGVVTGGLTGLILPGGGDWQTVGPDGQIDIAARYVLQLDDGLVEVDSKGLRYATPEAQARIARGEAPDPGDVYFRTAMRFHTTSPALAHLNRTLAVSAGRRLAQQVLLTVFKIP